MSLEAALAEDNSSNRDGPYLTSWKVGFKNGTLNAAKEALDALVAPITSHDGPRTDVITYAFSKSTLRDNDENHSVYFTEIFSGLEAGQNHLTEAEGEAMVSLFKNVQDRIGGLCQCSCLARRNSGRKCYPAKQWPPGRPRVMFLNPYPKSLLGGKWGRKLLPRPAKDAVMLEFRVESLTSVEVDRIVIPSSNL
eukprot:scaffold1750_cov108-Cylindrotheca_fusiformis.AAC.5